MTPRTVLLRLDLSDQSFPFTAGQAVMAGLPGQPARKPYAIACAPTLAVRLQTLELLVQVDALAPEPHLEVIASGSSVTVEGPFGQVLPLPAGDDAALLLVAGGTGIAPLRAILWEAVLATPPVRVALVYSARTREELAFRQELHDLADAGRLALHVVTTRDRDGASEGRHERIDAALLRLALPDPAARCHVCGPDGFVRDMVDALIANGVPRDRIAHG